MTAITVHKVSETSLLLHLDERIIAVLSSTMISLCEFNIAYNPEHLLRCFKKVNHVFILAISR